MGGGGSVQEVGETHTFVQTSVTITNGSSVPYIMGFERSNATVPGSGILGVRSVYDTTTGADAPAELLPGQSVTFLTAYAVTDPSNLKIWHRRDYDSPQLNFTCSLK